MTYANALKHFAAAPERGGESAEHLRRLLSRLGNPERKIRVLPITGDKGKSSVARMIVGILYRSGIKAAALTYPCTAAPKDSVLIGESTLKTDDFLLHMAALFREIRALAQEENPIPENTFTKNELLFCLAFMAASASDAKWMVLEIPDSPFTPLATVRFSSPITVITSCTENGFAAVTSLVHPGLSEVVSAPLNRPEAHRLISGACAKAGCRLTLPALSEVTINESSLRRTSFTYRKRDFTIPLYGDVSLINALTAIEAADALRRLGCAITPEGEAEGLLHAQLPARTELLSITPTVLVDAASDLFSLQALTAMLRKKGTAIGSHIKLCIEEGLDEHLLTPLLSLTAHGFTFEETATVTKGRENQAAISLLKEMKQQCLLLTVGSYSFAYMMRNHFLNTLKAL